MNFLRAENISKNYGERIIFDNLTISIEEGDKIALVAKNGTGKTTLMKILAGVDVSDGNGQVVFNKDIRRAFLPQEPDFSMFDTVYNALFEVDNDKVRAIAYYEKCLKEQESGDEKALEKLMDAMQEMDRHEAWDYEAQVKQILTMLNITNFDQPISTLSGGQIKRIGLAQILINKPDFIIMDEPTNHLDIPMIEWLEQYLSAQQITLLMVTHDRYFLDKVCNEIIELEQGRLYYYKGNYGYFLEKKEDRERRESIELHKANQLLSKELEWMRKQPRARGTKSKSRIEAFYELEEKAGKKIDDQKISLDIKMSRLGGKVAEFRNVSKSFGDKKVMDKFSYVFKPRERIGIIGKNGNGKSTFLDMLTGTTQPDSGFITIGDTIRIGYYTQKGIELKNDKRVIEVITDIAEYIEMNKGQKLTASQLLKLFLFDDKMQYTYVSKLSGGEKRRLYLLTVLMKNPNFLIMDEPTNDLDIATLNVLEYFLEEYKGCLLMVTHDRYFMDKLVDHLFVVEDAGQIRDFNGNYQDYLDEIEENKAKAAAEKTKAEKAKKENAQTETASTILFDNPKKKLSFKEQREYDELEKEIEKMEAQKSVLVEKLNSGDASHVELTEWAEQIKNITEAIDIKTLRWLELGN